MNIETANRLLQYRKQHNLSQEELAEKIGVSRQAVSKWERSEASPDTDNLISLAEVYGVSLDELLKGKPEDAVQEQNDPGTSGSDKTDKSSGSADAEIPKSQPDENTNYVREDKVSFKNGIHVNSKDGVHVEEHGKNRVYTDENGHIMVDEKLKNEHTKSPAHRFFLGFPFWAIALAVFLAWGFSGMYFGWALSWVALFSIPLYYSLVDAIFKRNPSHFAFPVLCAAMYIISGYFNICGGWRFGWIVFLTIPFYYIICNLIKPNKE